MRRSFKDFRLKELNGGLNLENNPNEIEDKQAIKCENFNFDGNKLVSSKGLYKKYDDELTGGVNGILIDGEDIYHTKGGKLFKNGIEVFSGLPDEKTYISIWFDYIFFTFDSGTQNPRYWDGATLTTKTGLGNPKYNITYNGKWILGGYGNDNIYFSKTGTPNNPTDILDFSAYSAGNQSVGGNSRGIITGFNIGENGLYVFKQNEIWYSNSDKDTGTNFNFIFNKITSNGAVNQYAIQEVDQEIFYFDGINKRVRRLSYEQNLTTLRDTAISSEIDNYLNTIDYDLSSTTLSYKYPNLKVFLPSDLVGVGVNDICLSYNVDRKSWSTETNKTCSVSAYGYLGSPYGGIIYEDNRGVGIVDSAISGEWVSKEFDLGDGVDYKKYGELEVLGQMNKGMNFNVEIYVDSNLVESRDIDVNETILPTLGTTTLGTSTLASGEGITNLTNFRERIDIYATGQYIQIKIKYSGIGIVEVSNLHIRWKPDFSYNNYY